MMAMVFLGTTLFACATTAPQELVSARDAYRRAAAGPAVKLAPAPLDDAKKALMRAEKEFADEPSSQKTRDLAYIAERHAQIAEAKASIQNSEQQKAHAQTLSTNALKDNLSKTKDQLAAAKEQGQATEQKLAVTEEKNLSTTAALEDEKRARLAAEEDARNAQAALEKIATVRQEERGLIISLSGGVLFASGQSTLISNAPATLDRVAEALKKGKPSQSITIEGHTDSQGSDATNQALSMRRAQAVREYLISRGLTANIQAVGMGESRAIADNTTAEGRANNRRVEIIVSPNRVESSSLQ
jgi:outer membrane protein OmpA-like peptidoglycan-associated protein